ncbi:MAG: phage integrase central domain-containing protein [Roseiflexaceae bacterium]
MNLTTQQPTVTQWCYTWLETFTPNLKPNIREDYKGVIKRYIESDVIGKRRLNKLTLAEVQAWVNRLSTRVAPQTVRNAHARLRKALAVAVRHGYIARNVAVGIELPQVRPLPGSRRSCEERMSLPLSLLLSRPQKRSPRLPKKSAGFRIGTLVPKAGLEPARGCPQRFLSSTCGRPQSSIAVFSGFLMRSKNPQLPYLFVNLGRLGYTLAT